MAARGLMPLSTQRKTKDGSQILVHDVLLKPYLKEDEEGNLYLAGIEFYPHNSKKLDDLLASEEWSWPEEEAPTESADFIQVAAVRNLMTATKAGIQTMALTDEEALKVKDMYPDWSEGIEVKTGERYNCDGSLWEVITTHTTQANWKPSQDTLSLWKKVQAEHAGTLEDPIPYEQGMALEKGKYYTQYDVIYECIMGTETGQPYDLYQLNTLVTPVD